MEESYIETGSWVGIVRTNDLDDLLDAKRFPPKESLGEILGMNEDRALKLARRMVKSFFKHLAISMIEDRTKFVLPVKNFGVMRIGNISEDPGSERYFVDPENDFKVAGGKIYLTEDVLKRNGSRMYRFKLVHKYIKILREKRNSRVRYLE